MPRRLFLTIPAIAVALALPGAALAPQAQTASAARATAPGLYTLEQANRGKSTFAASCLGCHTVASHTGDAFRATWNGRPLSDLFGFVSSRMPKSDPGSLTPDEYADVVAYVLKLNGVPAGDEELPSDLFALKKVRIDIPKEP